jgi:hypothetical protein
VSGVSTRRVDDLVRALGIEGISRSEASRICAGLDAEVAAFRSRPLGDVACPYLWLDATDLKVRIDGLARPYPKVAGLLADEADLLGHFAFPEGQRRDGPGRDPHDLRQPDTAAVREHLDEIATKLGAPGPLRSRLADDAG